MRHIPVCRGSRSRGRSVRRTPARSRGFSLVEMLVVLAILAMIILVGLTEVSRALKRSKLQSVAVDVRNFAQRTLLEYQNRNVQIFLTIGARATDLTTPLTLTADNNNNGVNDAGDVEIAWYTLPSDVVLYTGVAPTPADALYAGPKTQVASLNWSADTDDVTVARSLTCDFKSRALNTATNAQIAGVARLALSHVNMATGVSKLTPLTVYEIRINPLWNATMLKGVWDGTKFVY